MESPDFNGLWRKNYNMIVIQWEQQNYTTVPQIKLTCFCCCCSFVFVLFGWFLGINGNLKTAQRNQTEGEEGDSDGSKVFSWDRLPFQSEKHKEEMEIRSMDFSVLELLLWIKETWKDLLFAKAEYVGLPGHFFCMIWLLSLKEGFLGSYNTVLE